MIDICSISINNYLSLNEIIEGDIIIKPKQIIKVRSIEQDFLNEDIYTVNGSIPFCSLKPIIITEEWLVELSFTYDTTYGDWVQYKDKGGITLMREDNLWRINGDRLIEYVHQLQNLIKIYG
jgi:hypothetical protein